jgi:glyoxylase-like metal-dependent hydrolase (beta-lactamase superfamily II)
MTTRIAAILARPKDVPSLRPRPKDAPYVRARPKGAPYVRAGAVAIAALVVSLPLVAQQRTIEPSKFTRAPMLQGPPAGEVEVLPIRGNLYAIFGAGGNIVVSMGNDGVLIVDAGRAEMTDKVLAAVQRVQRDWVARNEPKPQGFGAETRSTVADRHITAPPKPIRYVINTSADSDHVGGNEKLRNAGHTFTGGNVAGNIADATEGAAILAHENVLTRLSHGEGQTAVPADALPTDAYFVDFYKLSHYFNGEGVQLFHMPKAHTDGDSIVHFRGTDVIALGDLMSTGSYPVIDITKGGTINGVLDGLNRVLDMSIAEFRLEGGTLMVPGHGRLVDSADVAYYRDMLTIIRDRVEDLIKKGRTLEQVKAANPSGDYDTEYGSTAGPWTTANFIEAVYKSLGAKAPATPTRRK